MRLSPVPLAQTERGQLHVTRIRRSVFAGALLIAALVMDFTWVREEVPAWLPHWLPTGLALLFALWRVGISAGRQWARVGYAFTGGELHVGHGWLVRVHTIVPVSRVQHIDVVQGMLQRWFDVATLVLHTAGTDASVVVLPGIHRETAEEIRDQIRVRIGGEA